jgi:hypothetical protein
MLRTIISVSLVSVAKVAATNVWGVSKGCGKQPEHQPGEMWEREVEYDGDSYTHYF